MGATAGVVSKNLIAVFQSVPEYAAYGDPDAIRSGEDAYRIAVGRLTKSWGDQLLELAESPPTPITLRDIHLIDALVERISAVISQLNDLDRARILDHDGLRSEALRSADASILKGLEEIARLMHGIHGPRNSSLWLKDSAAPIYRRLRRLSRDVARRNQVLRARRPPWREDASGVAPRV